MRKLLLVLALLSFTSPALTQNITCPTRSINDASNACASDAFVQNQLASGTGAMVIGTTPINGGTNTAILFDNSGLLGNAVPAGLLSFVGGTLNAEPTNVLAWAPPGTSTSIWNVLGSNGVAVSTGSSTTKGFQEAINKAFSGLGTEGYDLIVSGGGLSTGGAFNPQLTSQLTFPSSQDKYTSWGSAFPNITSAVGSSPCVVFDSQEDLTFNWYGGFFGCNSTGNDAIVFKPVTQTPLDHFFGMTAMVLNWQASPPIKLDYTGHANAFFSLNDWNFGELNGQLTSNPTYLFKTASVAAGSNYSYNFIKARQAHGVIGSGNTMWQIGNGAPAGGQDFGKNMYQLNLSTDGGTNQNGIDTYEQNSFYLANIAGITTGTCLKAETASLQNIFIIPFSSCAFPGTGIVDNGTQNWIWANGILQGGASGTQFRGLSAGGGSNSQFYGISVQPSYAWNITSAGTDQKLWDVVGNASGSNPNTLSFRTVNDAGNSALEWMKVTRGTGTAVTNVQFATNLSVTTNSTIIAAPNGGNGLQITSANAGNSNLTIDTFNTANPQNFVTMRSARGTSVSPTAVQTGDFIGQFGWTGYGATAFSSVNRALLGGVAAENWTDSAQGMYFALYTTATGGTTVSEKVRFQGSGGVSFGTTTDPGAGSLQINAQIFSPNITTSSAAQTGTVCWTTGTGKFTADTTVGCLTSLMQAKNINQRLSSDKALSIVDKLSPFSFNYKQGWGDSGQYEQFGLGAEEVAIVDERLVGRDPEGKLQGVRYQELTAVLSGAIKKLKADNDNLNARIQHLENLTVNRQ